MLTFSMTHHRQGDRIVWAGVTVTLFCCVVGLLSWLSIRQNFSFQGKSLRYWFSQLPPDHFHGGVGEVSTGRWVVDSMQRKYGSLLEDPLNAQAAIREIGTNCLPFLIAKLKRNESPIELRIQRFAFRVGLKQPWFENVEAQRAQATSGIMCFNPLPRQFLHEIDLLRINSNEKIAEKARYVHFYQKPADE
jgi:hypothetical protein